MISATSLATVRILSFCVGGGICWLFSAAVLLGWSPSGPVGWLPLVAGLGIAVLLFTTAFVAGPANTQAAMDESYAHDRATAASAGFWAALACGTTLWLTGLGGTGQLAITLTFASGVFFWTQVALDMRGRL